MRYADLAKRLEAAGCRTFWFGPAVDSEVAELARLLGVTLQGEFIEFLRQLGGGGVEGSWITGINGSAATEGYGTVLGDTQRLRETFGLAPNLVVLQIDEEEYAVCLDCDPTTGGAVVGLMLGIDDAPSPIAPSFTAFFEGYVSDQIEIERNS